MKKFIKPLKLLSGVIVLLGLCWIGRFGLLFKSPSKLSFPLTLKWQVDLGHSTFERPTYSEGQILFSANRFGGAYWYSLKAKSGEIIWKRNVPSNSFLRCLTSKYLVVSGPNSLLTLKPSTGELIWQSNNKANSASCSKTSVFTIGSRGTVGALNLSTGNLLWGGTTPRQTFFSLIYNDETDELIGDNSYFIEPDTGKIKRYSASMSINEPVEQARGPMLIINQDQLFVGATSIDAKTGQLIRKEERYGGFAAPTVTKDTLYVADSTEGIGSVGVIALNRVDYTTKWIYRPKHKFPFIPLVTLSPVAILDGVGYVIFYDATLRAFNLDSGQEIGYWQLRGMNLFFWPGCTVPPIPGCVQSSGIGMTTSDDTLFVSFGDGKLYAFGK